MTGWDGTSLTYDSHCDCELCEEQREQWALGRCGSNKTGAHKTQKECDRCGVLPTWYDERGIPRSSGDCPKCGGIYVRTLHPKEGTP